MLLTNRDGYLGKKEKGRREEERRGEEKIVKGGGSRKNVIVNGFFGFHLRIFEEVVG